MIEKIRDYLIASYVLWKHRKDIRTGDKISIVRTKSGWRCTDEWGGIGGCGFSRIGPEEALRNYLLSMAARDEFIKRAMEKPDNCWRVL